MAFAYEVTEELIQECGRILREAAGPGAEVILFGSRVRGDHRPDSDLDFMVVVDDDPPPSGWQLREHLTEKVGIDVMVVERGRAERWAKVSSTTIAHAFKEGRVVGVT